jgi:hypothetical protein
VADGLQAVLAGGGLQKVLSMFGGGNSGGANSLLNNPIVSSITENFTNKLTANHGLNGNQASGIAGTLIPNALNSLISKTNNPNDDSFDISSLIGSLAGGGQANASGQNIDLQGMLAKFTNGSLDADADGQVELSDIVSKITGGAQQQQTGAGVGGLMNMIQGLMK